MTYIVISHREVCGKTTGDTLTEEELQDAEVSAEALIAGNHIKASNTAPQSPSITIKAEEGATK
jgi:predicted methyltransferase